MENIDRLLEFFKFLYDCKLDEIFYRIFDITDVRMNLSYLFPEVKLDEKSHENFLQDHHQYIEGTLSHPGTAGRGVPLKYKVISIYICMPTT